jgi:hypothetical protein
MRAGVVKRFFIRKFDTAGKKNDNSGEFHSQLFPAVCAETFAKGPLPMPRARAYRPWKRKHFSNINDELNIKF